MGRWLLSFLFFLVLLAALLVGAYLYFYEPKLKELDEARREASFCAQESALLKSRVDDLESMMGELRQESSELEAQVRERELELEKSQSTQSQLLAELEQEIADGQIQVERLRGELRVDLVDAILFDSGEAVLKPEGREVLKRVASVLVSTDKLVQVHGHTDNVPIRGQLAKTFPTNWELSAARAVNVARFLQDETNIQPERLSANARSEYAPRASNDTDEGKQKNRRIEILLVPPPEPVPLDAVDKAVQP